MPNHRIQIPDQAYYRLEEIAKSIEGFPPQTGVKKGIDCISRKYLATNPLSNNLEYNFRLKGLTGSSPLNDNDRIQLSRRLPQLPEITDNMSDAEINNFFEEYYKLQDRPNWEPDIQTPADRQRIKNDYDKRITQQCENFISRAQVGHYHLFDSEFNVLRGSSLHPLFARKHALVSRADAEKYFEFLGLDFPTSQKVKPKKVTDKRWTREKVNEMREYRSHSTAKKTADYFGITVSRMNAIFRENPLTENEHFEASKPKKNDKKASPSNMNIFEAWSGKKKK